MAEFLPCKKGVILLYLMLHYVSDIFTLGRVLYISNFSLAFFTLPSKYCAADLTSPHSGVKSLLNEHLIFMRYSSKTCAMTEYLMRTQISIKNKSAFSEIIWTHYASSPTYLALSCQNARKLKKCLAAANLIKEWHFCNNVLYTARINRKMACLWQTLLTGNNVLK